LDKSPEERVRVRKRLALVLLGIVIAAVLWRWYVTYNMQVSLGESVASGVVVIIMGWYCVAMIFQTRKALTGLLRKIYLWIGTSTACINIFAIIYYAERWQVISMGAAHVLPLEALWRSLRFILWITFYCSLLWLTNYLKEMSEEYGFK